MSLFRTLSIGMILVVIAGAGDSHSVPLENWRLPWYRLAVILDDMESSPSGLFWDDLSLAGSFAEGLWPDADKFQKNHWTLEPAFRIGLANKEYPGATNHYWHGELLSNFRFRNFLVRNFLEVDSRYPKYPSEYYPWIQTYPAGGTFEEGYLQGDWNFGMVRLGRLKRNWGPYVDRSLLLSNNTFAYDGIEWQVRFPFLEFRHFLGGFPRHTSWRDSDASRSSSRFLTAHQLSLILGKWVSIGLFESMLFTNDGGFPDFQYINPFSIYFVTNTNNEFPGNLMFGLNWRIRPGWEKLTLKGQIALDDFQISHDENGQEPDHWACDLEASLREFIPIPIKHAITADFRYLSKWMYTVSNNNGDNGERYMYLRRSLGTDTIDCMGWGLSASLAGRRFWGAIAGFNYLMRGPTTIYTRWNDSGGNLGYIREPRFSDRDSIEHSTTVFVDALAHFSDYVDLRVGVQNRWLQVRDKGEYREGSRTSDAQVEAALTVHFSDFFLKF